jgi:hypothetical protein
MLERLSHWWKCIHFPVSAHAPLGFGEEYWNADPRHFEGWEQLRDRLNALGRSSTEPDLAYDLASHLLDDVIVAAGGVEATIIRLRLAHDTLQQYVNDNDIRAEHGIPLGLGHESATDAWYALTDMLSWCRGVIERVDRAAGDTKKFPRQGLISAIKPADLRNQCQQLLHKLRAGPVGQTRHLANFMLHSALVRHPFSGVQLELSGSITLPIPDTPGDRVAHWYLLAWREERDGFLFAETLWSCIESFVDRLIEAFESSVPERLRKR